MPSSKQNLSLTRRADGESVYHGYYGELKIGCMRLIGVKWLSPTELRFLDNYESPECQVWLYVFYESQRRGIRDIDLDEVIITNGSKIKHIDPGVSAVDLLWHVVKRPIKPVLTLKFVQQLVRKTILSEYTAL